MIVEELRRVVNETGQSPDRVPLSWMIGRPGVTSSLMGVSAPSKFTTMPPRSAFRFQQKIAASLDAVRT
jgi:aryl-alcohol dehydrogenase-like predicted oxidoreductase